MTDNEQNLLAAYRELYDALSEAVEETERTFPIRDDVGDDVTAIMTGPLGDDVRRLEALVASQS